MEPPPSLACANGHHALDVTAAAEPPEEPPVECAGVPVGVARAPKRPGSVVGRMPSSGALVLPHTTKPASR